MPPQNVPLRPEDHVEPKAIDGWQEEIPRNTPEFFFVKVTNVFIHKSVSPSRGMTQHQRHRWVNSA